MLSCTQEDETEKRLVAQGILRQPANDMDWSGFWDKTGEVPLADSSGAVGSGREDR